MNNEGVLLPLLEPDISGEALPLRLTCSVLLIGR